MEHITTKDATLYVKEGNKNLAATITPHHLALNRNSMFVGGIRPHFFCLPVLKRELHREALIKVAISGNSKFFLVMAGPGRIRIRQELSVYFLFP